MGMGREPREFFVRSYSSLSYLVLFIHLHGDLIIENLVQQIFCFRTKDSRV